MQIYSFIRVFDILKMFNELSFICWMEYLFSYGTLQNSDVQIRLFGRLLQGSEDTLVDYSSVQFEISDESFLSEVGERLQQTAEVSVGDVIGGMVFEVSSEELTAVDQYEPSGYQRISVKLGSGKQAWLYLAA